MDIGEFLKKVWLDYKNNFWLIFKISFWFIFIASIPLIVSTLFLSYYIFVPLEQITPLEALKTERNSTILTANVITGFEILDKVGNQSAEFSNYNPNLEQTIKVILIFTLILILFYLINFFFYLWGILATAFSFLFNEGKMTFKEAAKKSIKYFWKFIGLTIILTFISLAIMTPFFISLIITLLYVSSNKFTILVPILILNLVLFFGSVIILIYLFAIKWVFSLLIVMKENVGVFESMRRSWRITKGKELTIFVFSLINWLIFLGLFLVSTILLYTLTFPIKLLAAYFLFTNSFAYFITLLILFLIDKAHDVLLFITAGAFSMAFLKNLYFKIKNEEK